MAVGNKATFFFVDGFYGWQEVYYDNQTGNNLAQTATKAATLGRLRAKLLAQGGNPCNKSVCSVPRLAYIRASAVLNPRQTIILAPDKVNVTNNERVAPWAVPPSPGTNDGSGTVNTVATESPDNPWSGIQMLWDLSDDTVAKRVLTGVPDVDVCDQAASKTGAFVDAFRVFANELVNGWGTLSKRAVLVNGQVPAGALAITNVTQDAQGRPIITVQPPGWVPGATGSPFTNPCNMHLTIFGYTPQLHFPTINGTYRVFSATTPPTQPGLQWLLRKTFKPLNSAAALCLGYAIPTAPNVVSIMDVILGGPQKKNRGVPFYRPRGRRPTVRTA